MHDSSARIALVTGANKGIGYEITRQLAQAGLRVMLAARNPVLGQAAAVNLQNQELDAPRHSDQQRWHRGSCGWFARDR